LKTFINDFRSSSAADRYVAAKLSVLKALPQEPLHGTGGTKDLRDRSLFPALHRLEASVD
jgi:hypothetical protein